MVVATEAKVRAADATPQKKPRTPPRVLQLEVAWEKDRLRISAHEYLAGEATTEVYGDQGVVLQAYDDLVSTHLAPPGAVALKLYTRDRPEWQDLGIAIPPHHGERIAAVPRSFIDCLKHDLEPPVTAQDGRLSVEMVLGAYQSAREGRRVAFPL